MSLRNGFLRLMFVGLCAHAVDACADQNQPAAADADRGAGSSRVLVLNSWQVVKGNVRPRGDGYVIHHRTGRTFIGASQIWVMAKDLDEAHQKMKLSIQTITPDVNMRLAEWCSNQQMWGTAKQELLDALHQDPYREEAREMLAKVTAAQEAAAAPAGRRVSQAVDTSMQTGVVPPRKALGGLTTELARDFSRHIQPLLSNSCGDCHHAESGREFVLHGLDRNSGSASTHSGHNLLAIIEQLEPSDVQNSPLLAYSAKPHGGVKTAPFHGRLAVQHHRKLNEWSARVVSTLGQKSTGRASAIADRTKELQRPVSDAAVTPAAYVLSGDNPHGTVRRHEQSASEQLNEAAKRNRIDPFNPEIFNQRYHGKSASAADTAVSRIARRSP